MSDPKCSIPNCHARAYWLITNNNQTKVVCGDCRDELTALYNWKLIGPRKREDD